MTSGFLKLLLTAVLIVLAFCPSPASAQIERIGVEEAQGLSKAVVVRAPRLAFTSQIYPVDDAGNIVGKGSAEAQTIAVLSKLSHALQICNNAHLDDVVRLCVYLADPAAATGVRDEIVNGFSKNKRPAVSYVVTPLKLDGALVAVDAVVVDRSPGISDASNRENVTERIGAFPKVAADVMTVPARCLILVSGQAEKGELRESVRKTCDALVKTVAFANSGTNAIAHVKVFMNSLDDCDAVFEEMKKSHLTGTSELPAISFVQWTNNGPPEIEVVASAMLEPKNAPKHPSLEFLTPPWMTESPVYAKVTVTRSERLIFTSGLYGKPNANSEEQVTSLFTELAKVAKDAGSDMRHLAKATYYITNDDVGSKLNSLRPKYYDPKRPPAASKASVTGVGAAGCHITLDMIAVPVE